MNSAVLTASLTGRIQFFYCVALLRATSTTATTASSCCVHPPFANDRLDASASTRSIRLRGLKRGYEPPGAPCARHFFNAATACATSWGMSLLPAAEVRKTARRWRCPTFARCFRTSGPHSPSEIPCHRRFASRRPRDPYPRGTHCRAHANRRCVRSLTRCARVSLTFPSR
jgi:hypothetical protein